VKIIAFEHKARKKFLRVLAVVRLLRRGWRYGKWNVSAKLQEINVKKPISLKYETDDHIHGQKRNLHRSMNKMSPNMPRNINLKIFYLEKKNYREIRWPFIVPITHVKIVMA
jgi:hypothetical protein